MAEKKIKKYYITFPFNYKMGEHLVVEASREVDKIEVLCSIGATVWTEEEWKDTQEKF